jgi:hypothetical protein
MGCCGDREKGITVTEEQKWDYITLSDFKSSSCLTPLSYAWLWVLVLISGGVYAADAFTAVNLLAFDKWSSQVKPAVDFNITKWIFAITIIVSYVFLAYRWIRAIRVVRSGGVAECYLEPLAAIWQSMRLTKEGQGWRRFLVFAELTKSRKGVDYIALFVYFQFKGSMPKLDVLILAKSSRCSHRHPRPRSSSSHQRSDSLGCHESPDHTRGRTRCTQGQVPRRAILPQHRNHGATRKQTRDSRLLHHAVLLVHMGYCLLVSLLFRPVLRLFSLALCSKGGR